MKSKRTRRFVVMFLLLILLTSFVGCGSRKETATEESDYSKGEAGSMPAQEEISYDGVENEFYDEEVNGTPVENKIDSNRKMIQTKYYIIETLDFEKTTSDVETLVNKYLGYIESSQVSGRTLYYENYYNTRTAYYTMRVPAERLISFSDDLEALGNVIEENVTKEDVTTQLVDVEARIKSLEIQEERLLELLKTGGELKDILEIETQLSDVRYQIETYKATMNNLENKVSYGTVHLELREVIKETDKAKPAITIGDRISQGFIRSLSNIKDFFVNLFVVIIVALPYLVLWAAFVIFIILLVKGIIKKSKKKKAINSNPNEILGNSEETKIIENKDK